jgi:hypothetical protein
MLQKTNFTLMEKLFNIPSDIQGERKSFFTETVFGFFLSLLCSLLALIIFRRPTTAFLVKGQKHPSFAKCQRNSSIKNAIAHFLSLIAFQQETQSFLLPVHT